MGVRSEPYCALVPYWKVHPESTSVVLTVPCSTAELVVTEVAASVVAAGAAAVAEAAHRAKPARHSTSARPARFPMTVHIRMRAR